MIMMVAGAAEAVVGMVGMEGEEAGGIEVVVVSEGRGRGRW